MGLCFGFVTKTVLMTQGCFSCCWATLTQNRGLFCSSLCPVSEWAGGAQGVGRGHSRDSWPHLTKGIFHSMWHHAQHVKLGKEAGRGGGRWEWWHLASQVTGHVMEPCFPGDGWTPACQREVVKEFLVLLCLCAQLLLYLLNCLYLNPQVLSLLPLWFSPPLHWEGVSKQRCDP